jgi:hypothetical protein
MAWVSFQWKRGRREGDFSKGHWRLGVVVYPKKNRDNARFFPGERFEQRDAPFVMVVLGSTPAVG